jgi:hypothetical protein
MDDYSKTAPKTPGASAKSRETHMRRQMSELLAIEDEQTFIEALYLDYAIDERNPRFKQILKAWHELRRRQL